MITNDEMIVFLDDLFSDGSGLPPLGENDMNDVLSISGETVQSLVDKINIGVENGYTVEQQLAMFKQLWETGV